MEDIALTPVPTVLVDPQDILTPVCRRHARMGAWSIYLPLGRYGYYAAGRDLPGGNAAVLPIREAEFKNRRAVNNGFEPMPMAEVPEWARTSMLETLDVTLCDATGHPIEAAIADDGTIRLGEAAVEIIAAAAAAAAAAEAAAAAAEAAAEAEAEAELDLEASPASVTLRAPIAVAACAVHAFVRRDLFDAEFMVFAQSKGRAVRGVFRASRTPGRLDVLWRGLTHREAARSAVAALTGGWEQVASLPAEIGGEVEKECAELDAAMAVAA